MSMDFAPPPRKPRAENIVPMINVVFLLLVFFLMTSRLAGPEPFAVTPPSSGAGSAAGSGPVLHVSAAGETAFEDHRGAQAIAAFAARAAGDAGAAAGTAPQAPRLRADGALDGAEAARLLRRLAEGGVPRIELTVDGR